jgi:hypothetical protein
MRSLKPALAIATFAATLAACTTTDNSYYQPSYGYSQGYSYPSSGYYPRSNYYSSPGYGYYPAPTYPPRYGYSAPYNSNPGITFTIPMGGG